MLIGSSHPLAEMEYVVSDSQASFLLLGESFRETLRPLLISNRMVQPLYVSDMPSKMQVQVQDEDKLCSHLRSSDRALIIYTRS